MCRYGICARLDVTIPNTAKLKKSIPCLKYASGPELAAEVTLMPVRKLGVDAAILYSDIMNPVASLGIDFDIVKNIGPVIDNPIRSAKRCGTSSSH